MGNTTTTPPTARTAAHPDDPNAESDLDKMLDALNEMAADLVLNEYLYDAEEASLHETYVTYWICAICSSVNEAGDQVCWNCDQDSASADRMPSVMRTHAPLSGETHYRMAHGMSQE